jgi:O-antigen ligase
MRTVEADEEGKRDESAEGRLHYWLVAVEMSKARPLVGVGFNCFSQAYDEFDPARGEFGEKRTAHSTWFGTLGDLGYPGLGLLILLIVSSGWAAFRVERQAKKVPELQAIAPFALALQSSFVVMVVGGTFLHMQYTEMLWHFFALSMVMQRLAVEALDPSQVLEPAKRPVVPAAGAGGRPPVFDPRPTAAYASAPRRDSRSR